MDKILKAKQHVDFAKLELFKVKDIMLIPSMNWLEKRMPLFRTSIEKHGMKWPIVVTTNEYYWKDYWPKDENGVRKVGMAVSIGNKRVLWARENNYDMIEGYFVKSLMEKNKIIYKTFISKVNWPQ